MQLKPPESIRFNRQYPVGAGRIHRKTVDFPCIPAASLRSAPLDSWSRPAHFYDAVGFKYRMLFLLRRFQADPAFLGVLEQSGAFGA